MDKDKEYGQALTFLLCLLLAGAFLFSIASFMPTDSLFFQTFTIGGGLVTLSLFMFHILEQGEKENGKTTGN